MSEGERLLEFLAVMRRLRAECSWKQGQTHRSLARYLLEETHETLEALDIGDDEHLREELGDLLLQIWFHAVIAEERGAFSLEDVAGGIVEKMRRRNPHVFDPADGSPELDAVSVNEVWESIKATEKRRSSVFEGIPPELPALLYADKVLDRLSREGRTVDPPSPAESLGDRLLALVAEAREAGVDPEQALRDAVRRLA
ncbi:MazG family protein [Nocardioides sp.]|uniref:MazG family protein n=1 Tax=Nocardioides sp. TaxID=35761 RepID=UPI00273355EF|nr:MazG family protein [Nocardioides sp.]MDP3894602.1 MazG family protein [Nocardioides sp.]